MFNDILQWVAGAVGASTLLYLALLMFAPKVIEVAAEWLKAGTPLIQGISEGLVTLAKALWSGAKDIADSFNTVLTVLVLLVCVFLYAKIENSQVCSKESVITEFRKDYRFVKRSPEERRRYLRSINQPITKEGWWKWVGM